MPTLGTMSYGGGNLKKAIPTIRGKVKKKKKGYLGNT